MPPKEDEKLTSRNSIGTKFVRFWLERETLVRKVFTIPIFARSHIEALSLSGIRDDNETQGVREKNEHTTRTRIPLCVPMAEDQEPRIKDRNHENQR